MGVGILEAIVELSRRLRRCSSRRARRTLPLRPLGTAYAEALRGRVQGWQETQVQAAIPNVLIQGNGRWRIAATRIARDARTAPDLVLSLDASRGTNRNREEEAPIVRQCVEIRSS